MFEKYNINDLFLVHINVIYQYNDIDRETGLIKSGINSYEYFTIVLKSGYRYIDLQRSKKNKQYFASSTIDFIEPLSKYYTQEGIKKNKVSARQVKSSVKRYYNSFYNNYMNRNK